jgi:hypothetical protein
MSLPNNIDELRALKGFDKIDALIAHHENIRQLKIERGRKYRAMQMQDYRRKLKEKKNHTQGSAWPGEARRGKARKLIEKD